MLIGLLFDPTPLSSLPGVEGLVWRWHGRQRLKIWEIDLNPLFLY
jgi:hypothetical protein